MKKNSLSFILLATSLSLFMSCDNNEGKVKISGIVSDADGELLTLMHLTSNNPVMVDTLRLDASGKFLFNPTVEQGGPDFFCLVCNGQTIPVISDTLQTDVVINTSKERFGSACQINDSLNARLQQAVAKGSDMRRAVVNLTNRVRNGVISPALYSDSLEYVIGNYKQDVLSNYIYSDPASPISYYLLFETVAGVQIFNPLNETDNRAYGAVANLWMHTYPNSPRLAFLEKSAREGIALRIQNRRESEVADSLLKNGLITTSSFLDLKLIGINDDEVAFSSVNGHGNVTLLDFTAYYVAEASVPHNEVLNEVYRKYHDRGLSIYQVCLDADVNFWKVSAANIPWTVVRDPQLLFDDNGLVAFSAAAGTYNVQQIPTTFIMDRDGSVIARVEDDSKLDSEVSKAM